MRLILSSAFPFIVVIFSVHILFYSAFPILWWRPNFTVHTLFYSAHPSFTVNSLFYSAYPIILRCVFYFTVYNLFYSAYPILQCIPYFKVHTLFYSEYPILQCIPYFTYHILLCMSYFIVHTLFYSTFPILLDTVVHTFKKNKHRFCDLVPFYPPQPISVVKMPRVIYKRAFSVLHKKPLYSSLYQRLKGQCVLLFLSGRHVIKVTLMFNNVLHALLILHQSDLNELLSGTKAWVKYIK